MNKNCNIDKILNNNIIKKTENNCINNIKENISNNDENIKKNIMYKKVTPKKNKNTGRFMNEIKEDDEIENERSILPYDMTKRMNSFMDLSIVLNDNSKIKESVNNIQKNVSRIWGDISAIEKNDD